MVFQTVGVKNLDAAIKVRLTSEEKARLEEDADLAGLSMSELVRRRYFGRNIVAHADVVMVRELRRLGGLIKMVQTDSDGAYSVQTLDALKTINLFVSKMNNSSK